MFNQQGGLAFITGNVVKKYIKDGCVLADTEMQARISAAIDLSPGFATVLLPSRHINVKLPLNTPSAREWRRIFRGRCEVWPPRSSRDPEILEECPTFAAHAFPFKSCLTILKTVTPE